jgi:starch-binding outer membrane protein, SusD/RagB family
VTWLGPIADPVTPAARVDTMFNERAFWLFATGHRQGDLRRLIRQYGRTQARVFPTGLYKNTGQQYGTDVTFPITGDNANPSLPECLDRNP